MKDRNTRKCPKMLFGQNKCKLQRDKGKSLKPLRFQGFLVAGGGLEPPASGL